MLLLVIQTGGMAAVAVTFATYFLQLLDVPLAAAVVEALALAALAVVNCLGVRAGSAVHPAKRVVRRALREPAAVSGASAASPRAESPTTSPISSSSLGTSREIAGTSRPLAP